MVYKANKGSFDILITMLRYIYIYIFFFLSWHKFLEIKKKNAVSASLLKNQTGLVAGPTNADATTDTDKNPLNNIGDTWSTLPPSLYRHI